MSSDEEDFEYESSGDEDYDDYGISSGGGAGAGAGAGVSPVPLVRQPSYEVLSSDELKRRQLTLIQDVCALSELSTSVAGALLRRFQWKKQPALEAWFSDAHDKLAAELGAEEGPPAPPMDPAEDFDCESCFETVKGDATFALTCGHRLCRPCFTQFVESAVDQGPSCVFQLCFEPGCKVVVPESAFKEFCSDAKMKRYNMFVARSFVQDNPHFKPCPAPGCENVVHYKNAGTRAISCTCGHTFCWKCSNESHIPASCTNVQRWEDKKVESSTVTADLWAKENVKKCPFCKRSIWRDGGCNHMTCRREEGGCGKEFCWMCFAEWKTHGSATGGYYNCNLYTSKGAKGGLSAAAQVVYDAEQQRRRDEEELKRYEHYVDRFRGAIQSVAAANGKSKEKLAAHRLEMERHLADVDASDKVDVLGHALETVSRCRMLLAWTYVEGYYIGERGEAPKQLFEFQQRMLESHTDHLQELLEQRLESELGKYNKEIADGEVPDPMTLLTFLREVQTYHESTNTFQEKLGEAIESLDM